MQELETCKSTENRQLLVKLFSSRDISDISFRMAGAGVRQLRRMSLIVRSHSESFAAQSRIWRQISAHLIRIRYRGSENRKPL